MIPVLIPAAMSALTFLLIFVSALFVFATADYIVAFVRRHSVQRLAVDGAIWGGAEVPASASDTEYQPSWAHALVSKTRVEGYWLPEFLSYHRGHTWVAPQKSGTALVGVDEFAAKLLGTPTLIDLPPVGERCKQGGKAWTLSRNYKKLEMLSPLDGKIIAVNKEAIENPEILSKDPYGRGWLMLVKAPDLKRNLRNLLNGSLAKSWMADSALTLRSMFSGRVGLVFQDGGLPEDGLGDHLKASEWNEIVNCLFGQEAD